jgi:LmbE family N-acetylglucosaminyl deacetylase
MSPDRLIRPEDPAVTSELRWDAYLRDRPRLSLPDADVVVVAPHPDDETLGAGGLICAAARSGRRVRIVVCTDGEAASDAPDLGARRRSETLAALDVLTGGAGVEVEFLGLPDGGLDVVSAAVADVVAPMLASRPLLVAPWSLDGHPDHDAVGRRCAELADGLGAVAVWQYPVWAWHWATPLELAGRRVACLPLELGIRRTKRRALDAFESQISPSAGPPTLPNAVRAHFRRPYEAYVLA